MYTRDTVLATIVRNIWLHDAEKDIQLQVINLPGKDNVTADLLSRWEGVAGQVKKFYRTHSGVQFVKINLNMKLEFKEDKF